MFLCNKCGKDPCGPDRCPQCPHVYHNILNVNYKDFNDFNLDNFKEKYPVYFKKYDKGNGEVKDGVIYQYKFVLEKLNIKKGTVLDFGCALAHASETIKQYSPNLTYIGADVSKDVLFAASTLYKTADYLINIESYNEKSKDGTRNIYRMEAGPLKYLPNNSVDLVIASRIAGWENYDIFFPEFARVLKPGGHLFFWSNAGHFDYKKVEMFDYLIRKFDPISSDLKIKRKEALSLMMWGDKDAFSREDKTEEQNKYKLRGLMVRNKK